MAGQKFTLTFDAQLNVSQMNGALKQIQSTLNGLHLPQNVTRGLQGGIDKLQKEITNFESLASKDITSKADMSKLETQAQKVSDAFSQLRRSFANLTGLNGKDLEKLFPSNISKNITDAKKALNGYTKTLNDAKDAVRAQNTQVKDLKQSIADLQGKKTYTNTEWKQLQNDIKAAEAELEKYKQLKEQAEAKRDAKQAQLPATYKNSSIWRDAVKEVQNYESEIEQAQKKLDALNKAKVTGIKQEDQIKGLQKLNAELTTEEQKLQQLVQVLQNLNSKNQGGGLQQLIQQVGQLTGLDMTQFKQSTEGVGEAIRVYLNQQLQQLGVNLNNAANSVNNIDHVFANNRSQVRDCAEAYEQFNMQAREVEQLKSRIQYFFSLNNAILLVKRTLREAYQTIKELDKAMTETAVVTDFSVGDMWAQLPDYTARANELGVTTKAAYEAATLFYQQGLKTNEVMAMSNETLKMARIAGLDAAVATDRMTNAIRGFNMEINEINAQRIDDVYSRLAAISASNVDEISTAMTKVASLAHNANMEFETTAAFLAQIIETTRESAETAGTALKTVVARFSEVKKLVDEGELSGKDEEGEVIDVNKVSEALRTAGIDLNKYFLGEIGLDDIFIELASKWDSLTTIQQRYIATQAAGSRQQSRFIALMSDYARTQELVGEAYNANGAAAKQFAKTQESLESKLARLKNAWNEFAMGIMNSDLVKAGVDLLTNILNGINALTSGFSQLNEGIGGVINSVSKLLMLFGGLGLGKTLLGGLTASISNIGLLAAGKAPLDVAKAMSTAAVGANATGAIAGLASRGAGGALLAGFLNPFARVGAGIKGVGQSIWGGLQTRGLQQGVLSGVLGTGAAKGSLAARAYGGLTAAGVSGETALGLSGLASLAPALLGVAAAVGAVVAAYKLWEKYTPEGQLKVARKIAEENQKIADQKQEEADSIKKLQDGYNEYTAKVNEAKTTSDYEDAVTARNEAILKAIEENSDYAQFLQTDFDVNGQLVLTLDEGKVTDAAIEAAKAATAAAIQSYFAQAEVSMKEAAITAAKQQDRTIGSQNGIMAGGGPTIQGDKSVTTENLRQGQLRSAANYATLGYAEMIHMADMGLDKELSSSLAKMLGNIYAATGKVIEQGTLESIEQSLLDNKLDSKIISTAVAESFDFSLANIDLNTEEGLDVFLSALDISSKELIDFANILGVETSDIRNILSQRAKEVKKIETNMRANIYEKGMRAHQNITPQFQEYLNDLNLEQLNTITDVINSTVDSINEEAFGKLFAQLPNLAKEELIEIGNFFNNFSLDDPLQAFDQLNSKINELSKTKRLDSTFGQMLANIKEVNAELFTASSLVQDFFISNAYDELSDSLDDFIKENDRISADNIEELADSSKLLKQLLDSNIVSAKALANALTLVEQGKIDFEQLTDAMLKALDAGTSFEEMMEGVDKWIKDFDPGTDLKDGTEHIIEQLGNLKEYVSNWEFGNEPTKNIYESLFGKGTYDALVDQFGNDFEAFEKFVIGQIEQYSSWAENAGLGGIQRATAVGVPGLKEIAGSGGQFFEWDLSQFNTTTEAIDSVASALGVTQEAAEAFILSWQTHMPKLRTEWDDLNYNTQLQAFAQSLSDTRAITEQQLAALGAAVGKTAEEVKKDLENLRDENGNPIEIPVIVNWQDEEGNDLTGDALKDKFAETFGTQHIDYGTQGREISYTPDYAKYAADFTTKLESGIAEAANGIDAQGLIGRLLEDGFSQAQANEMADEIAGSLNDSMLTQTIQVPKVETAENGELLITSEDVTVAADSMDGLKAAADAAIQAANYEVAAQKLAESDLSGFSTNVTNILNTAIQSVADSMGGTIEGAAAKAGGAISAAGSTAISEIATYLANTPMYGTIILTAQATGTGATGGLVRSLAGGSGDYFLQPGFALTGEEGPEIVWNKERGYAYITGQNGAEFQNLQPGDRVFNAAETSRIFRNSSFAKGGVFESYASGGWKPSTGSTGSGGSSDGNSKKESTWRNELDWLYDLMEDIAEYERQQNIIQAHNELALEDIASSGRDLYKLTREELINLETQLDGQQAAQLKRLQQMGELQTQVNAAGYGRYMQWNQQDQTLEIDWDAIEAIQDKETYDEVVDWLNRMESVQDQIDDAEDAIWDIKKQIQELQQRYLQKYLDFQNRVLDAIVKQYQDQIDKLTELNNDVNDTNASILDSIQREIDLERQIRDNTDVESDIANLEARLAYLQRDTTGANAAEIRSLQDQLNEARISYGDTLIDQAVDRLAQSNEDAAAQREKQIELMQAQLDYWQESGGLWSEVEQLISTGFNGNGSLIRGSDLEKVLQNAENYEAMSQAQRDNWANELILETNQVGAHILELANGMNVNAEQIRALLTNLTGRLGGTPVHSYTAEKAEEKYATGGLNTYTGLAHLDGTPSAPEYVLNPEQTNAFLRLADVLPSIMGGDSISGTTYGGDIYLNLSMHVDEIASDYDVDRIADRVKDILYDASSYRNVNTLNFIR